MCVNKVLSVFKTLSPHCKVNKMCIQALQRPKQDKRLSTIYTTLHVLFINLNEKVAVKLKVIYSRHFFMFSELSERNFEVILANTADAKLKSFYISGQ